MMIALEPPSSLDRPILAEMYRRVVTRAKDWRIFLDQHVRLLDADITMGNKDTLDRYLILNAQSKDKWKG